MPDGGPLTSRRRKRWCYECQAYTLTHIYPTDLLEEQIALCDRCVTREKAESREPVYVAGAGWKGGPVGYLDKDGMVYPAREKAEAPDGH